MLNIVAVKVNFYHLQKSANMKYHKGSVSILCVLWIMLLNIDTATSNCAFSCETMDDGDYQSCKSCNIFTTCANNISSEIRCSPPELVFNIRKGRCEYNEGTCPATNSLGLKTRLLCRHYLSDQQPLCRFLADIKLIRILEINLSVPLQKNNCAAATSTDASLEWLTEAHVCKLRQRNDMMFNNIVFDVNAFYTSEPQHSPWEKHEDCSNMNPQQNDNRIFHITFVCVKNHPIEFVNVFPADSKHKLATNGTVYIRNLQSKKEILKTKVTIFLCEIHLARNGSYYIAGPGTIFIKNSALQNEHLRLIGITQDNDYTVEPGLLHENRHRFEVNTTDDGDVVYTLVYEGNRVHPPYMLLPVGVLEGKTGHIEVSCNGDDPKTIPATSVPNDSSHEPVTSEKENSGTVTAVVVTLCVIVTVVVITTVAVFLHKRHQKGTEETKLPSPTPSPNNNYEDIPNSVMSKPSLSIDTDVYTKPNKPGISKTPLACANTKYSDRPTEADYGILKVDLHSDGSKDDNGFVENVVYEGITDALEAPDEATDMAAKVVYYVDGYIDLDLRNKAGKHAYTELEPTPETADKTSQLTEDRVDHQVYECGEKEDSDEYKQNSESRQSDIDMVENCVYNQ